MFGVLSFAAAPKGPGSGPRSLRKVVAGAAAGATILLGGVFSQNLPPAQAGPGDLVFGVVYADANGNGSLDTTGLAGTDDVGVQAAVVTLRDTSLAPTDPEYAGWTVTTAADGSWAFPLTGGWSDNDGPFTVTVDAAGVANDAYTTQAGNGWAAVAGQPQQAVSAPFNADAAPLQLGDLLLDPVWQLQLAVPNDSGGWNGLNILTGSAPWDDNSTDPGQDAGPADDVVRSGDSLMMNWTVTASAREASLGDQTGPVVLEQTLALNPGAQVNFARIPGMCVADSAPASRIVAQPSGTTVAAGAALPAGTTALVLTCQLGNMGTAANTPSGFIVPVTLMPLGTSVAGSTFTTSARAYAVAPNGAAVATPSTSPVSPGPFTVTSAPRFDISKRAVTTEWGMSTINGVSTPVYRYYYRILISTDRKTGIESLGNSISVTEDFWAQLPNSNNEVMTDLPWYIESCYTTNTKLTGYYINSSLGSTADPLGQASVSNSGTCTVTPRAEGDDNSPMTLTFNNVDTSGQHYPTRTIGSTTDNLAAGPFYVAAYTLRIVIPITAFDAADGIMGNSTGTLALYNQLTGFDPEGISGRSNYGSGYEPGYCAPRTGDDEHALCDLMDDGGRSNNVTGPATVNHPSPGGTFHLYLFRKTAAWSNGYSVLPGAVDTHDGQGTVAPGSTYMAWNRIYDATYINPLDLSQRTGLCTVFDNRTTKLAPLAGATGLSSAQAEQLDPDQYAMIILLAPYAGDKATQQPLQDLFDFQYGAADWGTDVSNDGIHDAVSGRYGGDWTNQRTFSCRDDATTWYDSPAVVPGGVDAVNVVRVTAKPGLEPGEYQTQALYLEVGLQQRNTYYQPAPGGAGMVDTQVEIPSGTVAAVFGRPLLERVAGYADWWAGRSYVPQPENGHLDGDRWTIVRATGSLAVETVKVDLNGTMTGDGVSSVGVVGAAQAGRPIVWKVNAGFAPAPGAPTEGTVQNTVIMLTIPPDVTYNADLTRQLAGGTAADSTLLNPDGSMTLTWNLGEWQIEDTLPPRIIYTDSNALAAAGTTLVASAVLSSTSVPATPAMKGTHTVVLDQPGSVQVRLDTNGTRYLTDTTQGYTAVIRNFSASLGIDNPVVYNKLPSAGDGISAVAGRHPASDFTGTARLGSPVTAVDLDGVAVPGTVYYWVGDAAAMPERPEADSAAQAGWWKTAAELGGDLSAVTGWKFIAGAALDKTGSAASAMLLSYDLQPLGNTPGDSYSNRFAAYSTTLKQGDDYQVLASNQTVVSVLGFSLGDLVWIDVNHDGIFTEGTDQVAPAGVVVQVYHVSGSLAGLATTNHQGRWVVNNLGVSHITGPVAADQYYAVIPATEFATGGRLAGYRASIHQVGQPDDDANETADHNAVAAPGGGVRSQPITLNASVDPATGVVLAGGEPLNDNVKGLATPALTGDDYTNMTLDLALEEVSGSFQVAKAWDGPQPAWGEPGDPVYEGTWSCTRGGLTVASGTWAVSGTGVAELVSLVGRPATEIPAGAICSAAEDTDPVTGWPVVALPDDKLVWAGVTVSPAVTIEADATATVTVTNAVISADEPPDEQQPTEPDSVPEPVAATGGAAATGPGPLAAAVWLALAGAALAVRRRWAA